MNLPIQANRGYVPTPNKSAFRNGAGGAHRRAMVAPIQVYDALTLGQLQDEHRELRPAIIDGLLRRGEILNVVAAPKVGKSWLAHQLAIATVMGASWLGFPVKRGRVLIIDNELHEPNLAARLETLSKSANADLKIVREEIHIIPLRGRLADLRELGPSLKALSDQGFDLVILDALYRMLPPGTDENDNGAIAQLYNLLDSYAAMLDAAIACIHHTSKGKQGGKSVTDSGAGAGAQSRAADSHLVIREHVEQGAFVVDAVTRSFPPPRSVVIRRSEPGWQLADDLDPGDVKPDSSRRNRQVKESSQREPWTPERFIKEFITAEPRETKALQSLARQAGMSQRNATEILHQLREHELVHYEPHQGQRAAYYLLKASRICE